MGQLMQPSIFISHGTIYEAFKSNHLKSAFLKLRKEHLKKSPSAIVLFSGHWQTETISITTTEKMIQMEEGFPPEFQTNYSTVGNPELAQRIIELLTENGIKAKAENNRGLDHGALIPLILLFPNDNIPVLQISQHYNLDTGYHKRIAEILNPLRNDNILFIGSGGLVHNRSEIQKFGGHEIEPDNWAKEFDDFITNELADKSNTNYADKIISAYNHKQFFKSHPTSEHFLPIVFASAFGGQPTKIYEAFQWKNLSMSAFKFD
ncbi:MAG: class III extradiol ring-cleavage dioxygenase [Mariniphaga sp.]